MLAIPGVSVSDAEGFHRPSAIGYTVPKPSPSAALAVTDPNPVAADPTPTLAPAPLVLAEPYPACFDWGCPRPLKINIHQDLIAAGHDRAAVRCALAASCAAPRYREA